ncbi:MAG: NAD(P)/FAD-dependent oxidoreductase [Thermodesulfobacteriota bacterium]|nr:NAD(P)/FAD-dependent oxidoreductase [Thermodesulfobacteriota bacterium]
MAETDYDVIFIGGGHNGLTCGSYLAKAGLKVIVLERRHNIGGCVCTEEVTLPGFKHNLHSFYHGWIHAGPVYKELELEKYGCRYVFPEEQYAVVLRDGSSLVFYQDMNKTCKEIEKFSRKNARTYRDMVQKYEPLKGIIFGAFFNPPVPPSRQYAPFEGTEEGLDFLSYQMSSPQRICDELFESDIVKLWVCAMTAQIGTPTDAWGSGYSVPIMFSSMHTKPWGICVGGSRMVAEAMVKSLEASGGKVIKNVHVEKVIVEGGTSRGVRLTDGTEIIAEKAVVSNISPMGTLIDLVGEEHLDDDFADNVKLWLEDDIMLFTPHYALNKSPDWKAAKDNPAVNKCFGVWFGVESVYELQTQWNDIKEGAIPRYPGGLATCVTIHESKSGSAGKTYGLYVAVYHL